MSVNEKGTISFIYIANPLQPAETRTLVQHRYKARKLLSTYLGDLEGEWAVSVSGHLVHRSQWAKTRLNKDDVVVVAPILAGGGGSKNILRVVALIALTFVSGGVAGGAIGSLSGGMAAAAGAAVMVGGTLIINAVLPPAPMDMGAAGDGFASSPTYGIDGPKNLSTRGVPVPVVYGESWFAGNFNQTHTVNEGDDQYLMMLLNVGEGPIEGISDIHINNQPVHNFDGVEVFVRHGTDTQESIPYFNDVIRPYASGATLQTNSWVTHLLEPGADRVRLDFTFPRGLSYAHDKGMRATTAVFMAEIREVGGVWRPLLDPKPPKPGMPAPAPTNQISVTEKSTYPIRRSFSSGTLDRTKRYEVRACHTQNDNQERVANTIVLTDVNEVRFGDLRYKHTAMLGLRIRLSEQLNGIPQVTYRVKGRKVRVWDYDAGGFVEKWSANPAWIVLDAMTNERFGGKMRLERFKLDYFRQWAKFCDDNKLYFNGAIDQKTNLWDALLPVYKVGRAQPVRSGTKFQIAIMGKRKPVQLFSMTNIKKNSMNLEWLSMDDRANQITVTYADRDDFGKQKSVTVLQERARLRGDHPKSTEMQLFGVDNAEQANREATLAMNMNVLYQTVSFEAPIESIACTLGDVIAVQHDMPKWGQGGLLEAGSTSTKLNLDHQVEFDRDGEWVVMVRHDKVIQWSGKVVSIMGNNLVLDNTFDVEQYSRFRRCVNVVSGVETQVYEGIQDTRGRHGVHVESAAGVRVGDTVQLIDTEVIETRTVLRQSGVNHVSTLTLSQPLSAIPSAGTAYAFGLRNNVVTLFSVTGIEGTGEMWRKIKGIEYSDEAYSDEVKEYQPGIAPALPVLDNVTFGGFYTSRYLDGSVYRTNVEFNWTHPSTAYLYAEIHASINDNPYRLVGTAQSAYSIEIAAGTVKVKIVPVNMQGSKPSLDAMDEHVHVVEEGAPTRPPVPTDVRAYVSQGTIDLRWNRAGDSEGTELIYRYEVWMAPGAKEQVSILDASLLAVTGDTYFILTGVLPDTRHTFWVRTVNVLDNSKVSDFAPNDGLTVESAPPLTVEDIFPGGIDTSELFPDGLRFEELFPDGLRVEELFPNGASEEITREVSEKLNYIADVVSKVSSKVEMATDGYKTEVFNRRLALGQMEALVRQELTLLAEQDEVIAGLLTQLESKVSDDIVARLTEEALTRATADEALAASVRTLETQVNEDIQAALTEERTARATADEALSASVDRLHAQVNDDIAAALVEERLVRTTADEALSASIDTLKATVDNDISAALSEERIARTTADQALSQSVSNLQTQMGQDIAAAVRSESVARSEADEALAGTVEALKAQTGKDIEAAIKNEQVARSTADAQLAASVTALQVKMGDDISAAVTAERNARTSADEAIAASLEEYRAQLKGDITAAITAERGARTTEDQAIVASVDKLRTQFGNDLTAAISAEQLARSNADSAMTTAINTAQSTANAKVKTYRQATAPTSGMTAGDIWFNTSKNNAPSRYSGSAWESTEDPRIAQNKAAIESEASTRATADEALTAQVTAARSVADAKNKTYRQGTAPTTGMAAGDIWYNTNDNNKPMRYSGSAWVATDDPRTAQNQAAIETEALTRANADSALSSQISTLSASTTTQFASVRTEIQAQAKYTDGAIARAVTTATVNGKTAIFGINVNGATADIGAVADRFFIYNSVNGSYVQPFRVEGGNVFINTAFIKQADIINAVISGTLTSPNYIAGREGLRINFVTGAFELNGQISGQGRMSVTNQAIKVYDGAGRLRVQLGNLNA